MEKTPKKFLKWLIFSLILGGILLMAVYVFKPKPAKTHYLTATVEVGDIENSVMASGKIEAKTQVDVGSQVSGEVTNLYVEVGDEVNQGQIIAQIDPITQQNALTTQKANLQQSLANLTSIKANLVNKQANVATAEAELAKNQSQLQQAKTDYQRLQTLDPLNAISKQEFEKAALAVKNAQTAVKVAQNTLNSAKASLAAGQADIQTAKANILKAQTEVHTAEKNLNRTQIIAPMSGTVISITTKQGQTVNANQSAPTIVTLADLKTVRVKAKISEADVIHLTKGMPVYFNVIGNPDKKYHAILKAIEPAPQGTTANTNNNDTAIYYLGYFDVPNVDGQLRINMTAQVYIVQDSVKNVLNVPATAIKQNKQLGHYVEILQKDGSSKQQAVTIGLSNRVHTQIISGVEQGQQIILSENNPQTKPTQRKRSFM